MADWDLTTLPWMPFISSFLGVIHSMALDPQQSDIFFWSLLENVGGKKQKTKNKKQKNQSSYESADFVEGLDYDLFQETEISLKWK